MKLATRVFFAICFFSTCLCGQPVKYFVDKDEGSMSGALRAKVGNKTYTIVDASQEMCLAIVDQRDWNGDGTIDALVTHIQGCGGNCCSDTFFFVSALGNGIFKVSDELSDSWSSPIIEKWRGKWSAVIESTNEGMNTDRPKQVTSRFILKGAAAVEVTSWQCEEISAVVEMRSEIFKGDTDEHSIQYDLDGDGKKDTIHGVLWPRWGKIVWDVQFANGKEYSQGVDEGGCKRIGVLKTSTNGLHDLVCDEDGILRWTGDAYSEKLHPSPGRPSFDCAKASTAVERLLCADDDLAAVERKMATSYKGKFASTTPDRQTALKQDQLEWLKDYARACNLGVKETDRRNCVQRWLLERIGELASRK